MNWRGLHQALPESITCQIECVPTYDRVRTGIRTLS